MGTKTFIKWSKPERRAVMAEMLRLEKTGDFGDGFKSQPARMRKAQLCLPPERRHAISSSGAACTFFKELRHLEKSGHVHPAEMPPAEQPAPPVAHVAAPHESVAEILKADESVPFMVVERVIIQKELPDYGQIPTVTLARVLLERLANLEEVQANLFHLQQSFERKKANEQTYDRRMETRPPASQPKPEAMRVCVIGLLPDQQRVVLDKVAGISRPLKITFLEANNQGRELPHILDYIICARFIHHAWYEKAKAAMPKDTVFFIDGGVGEVIQKIYDLSARQTPAASTNTTYSPAPVNGHH